MTNAIGRRSALAGMVGTATVTQSRLAWAADPIKIGFSIPQSGGLAALGRQALLTMEIWANDVNAKGGMLGRPVQLVTYDDQSNPANVPPIYTSRRDGWSTTKTSLQVSSTAGSASTSGAYRTSTCGSNASSSPAVGSMKSVFANSAW